MWRFILVTFAFLGWSFYELSGGADYQPVANSIQTQADEDDSRVAAADPGKDNGRDTDTALADPDPEGDESVTRSAASLADLTLAEPKEDRFRISLAAVEPSNEYDGESLPETVEMKTVAAAIDAAVEEANATVLPETTQTAEVQTAEVQATEVQTAEVQFTDVQVTDGQAALPDQMIGVEVFSLEAYVQALNTADQPNEVAYYGQSIVAASGTGGDIRVVSGEVVNMRAGPGTDYAAVGTLSRGDRIMVLDEPGNGWLLFEVVETGETGWMADWLVTASN